MSFIDQMLFISAIVLLLASIYLSFKTRFIQIRAIPEMIRALFRKDDRSGKGQMIIPKRALFTAMSTTLGLGTMIAPIIAIKIGGPGSLVGFLLTTLFGAAATFTEVSLSVEHRKILSGGRILGGPMQYLADLFSERLAQWYALCCLLIMAAWSGAQSNQIAALLSSPFFEPCEIPKIATGIFLGIFVLVFLTKGIAWIGKLSEKMVPLMFCLYVGGCLYIVLMHISQLPSIFYDVFSSCLSPFQLASGALIGGISSSLRWGIFKGMHCTEAGVGTQTFPHSVADTSDPVQQGIMAMISTYSAGGLSLIGGIVALITGTWQDDSLATGIPMLVASFEQHFSGYGTLIVGCSAFLFALGTVLGNAYNGSVCFSYLTRYRYLTLYFVLSACTIAIGAISEVTLFWAYSDLLVALAAIPHVLALTVVVWKKAGVMKPSTLQSALKKQGFAAQNTM